MTNGSDVYKEIILEYVAVSGEVRIKDLYPIGASKKHIYRVVSEYVSNGILKQSEFEGNNTIRLTNVGKKYMLKTYQGKYDTMFTGYSETNKIRTEQGRRDRNLKLAQIKIMLGQSGINVFNKPILSLKVSGAERADGADFYTSTEIKSQVSEFMQIRNSRALGILITDKSICILYNTGDKLMRWCEEDERYFRTIVNTAINQKLYANKKIIKNIVIMTENQMPSRILESSGGNKNTNLRIDNSVQNLHMANYGRDESVVLDILLDKIDYSYMLQKFIVYFGLNKKDARASTVYDSNGNEIVFGFDMNLKAIDNFCKKLVIMKKKGIIYCFDFQKKYIEDYCNGVCDIKTIREEEFNNVSE